MLYIKASQWFSLLPASVADAGRVHSDVDVRKGLNAFHTGFGSGVYVDVLKQAIVNVTYSVGEEKLVFVGFNFLFQGLLLPAGALGPERCKHFGFGHGEKSYNIRL